MNILAMDTSNQILGIAILRDGKVAGEHLTNLSRNHSVRLMPAVEELMREVNMEPEDLDKIVVANGPGSYTGVRIGVTTAKTMGWALDIPVAAVSSLEALAYQGRFSNDLICPFFDARRGLVFTGLWKWDEKGLLSVREEQNMLLEDLLTVMKETGQRVLFISPDIELHQAKIKETLGGLAIIPEPAYHVPSPVLLAYRGMSKEPEDVHNVTPNYLRLAEAEAKWIQLKKDLQNHE